MGFLLPNMLNRLGPVLESDKEAPLVQDLNAADELPGSDIVVYLDHPAFLRERCIEFLHASFKDDRVLPPRLQFCLDPHLSSLTQSISILRYIFI